jgi:methionyl aminopeptidase
MIVLKSARELEIMKEAGRISAGALMEVGKYVRPGVSTLELDEVCYNYIKSQGAEPNFLHLYDFPNTACISVNDEIIHGIPSKNRILKEGDIVSLDAGLIWKGWHSDAARTWGVGTISPEAEKLIETTRRSFYEGIAKAVWRAHLYDISAAVEECAEREGYGVVRELTGHGIGKHLHEPPMIPNVRQKGRGLLLVPGMTFAVEPMINLGSAEVSFTDDGSVRTKDGLISAHYENTIVITEGEAEILTL